MEEQISEVKQSAYQVQMGKAWDFYYEDQLDTCMGICLALINEFPDKSECHYLLGHVLRLKEDYKSCVEHFEIALANDDGKNAGYIYYWLGEVYGKSGWLEKEDKYVYDRKKSEESYKNARKCEQYPPDLLLVEDYNLPDQEKIETYELGIERFSDLPDFYVKLARHYAEFGLSEMQIKTLQRAFDHKLASSSLFYNMGYVYFKKGDFEMAEKFFSDALEHNKEYPGYNFAINYLLGKAAESLQDFDKAEACYKNAYVEEKDHPDKMFGFLGLVSIYLATNEQNKLEELILNLDVKSDLLTSGNGLTECVARFSRLVCDIVHFEDLAELYKSFNSFKPSAGKDLLNGKVWIIRYYLANNLSKHADQYKAISNIRKFLNEWQFDYLDELHSKALRNLLVFKAKTLKDVTNFYTILTKDLDAGYYIRPFIVENLNLIVNKLYEHGQYGNIATFSKNFKLIELKNSEVLFKMAYSCSNVKDYQKAKELYQQYIKLHGESSAVLNNLGILFKRDNKFEEAIELYRKGLKIAPDDEHLNSNLKAALSELKAEAARVNREENLRKEHQASTASLSLENDWVLEKLLNFVAEVQKDGGFDNWEVPLAKFKFQKFLNVDKQRAESLINQWLGKGYIKDTGYRDDYRVIIYSVNPFIEDEIKRIQKRKIPQEWLNGFVNINIGALDTCGYFGIVEKIAKTGKKFRMMIERDYNELTYNYLLGHHKSTIVLSGSLVELMLIYYCERKKLTSLTWKDVKGNPKTRKLYDCVLNDLIEYVDQNKLFGADFVHLSNLSRIYRNFIHPGKELKSSLDKSKADLCFISVSEILRNIL